MSSDTKDECDVPVEDVEEDDVAGCGTFLAATGLLAMNHVASSGVSSWSLAAG